MNENKQLQMTVSEYVSPETNAVFLAPEGILCFSTEVLGFGTETLEVDDVNPWTLN